MSTRWVGGLAGAVILLPDNLKCLVGNLTRPLLIRLSMRCRG